MFSFLNYTKKETKVIAEKKREIKETTDTAAEALRECLESNTFKKYREDLENANTALIEIGMDIMKSIKDPKERVYLYDSLFVRADVLGLLLKKVNSETK